MRTLPRALVLALGLIIPACGGGDSASSDSVPGPPAAQPVPSPSPDSSAGVVPAAPVQWTLPLIERAIRSAGFTDARRLGALGSLSSLALPSTVMTDNAMVFDLDGSEIMIVMMSDQVIAGRAADSLRARYPSALVFTSSNVAAIAPRPNPRIEALRDTLTSIGARSGWR